MGVFRGHEVEGAGKIRPRPGERRTDEDIPQLRAACLALRIAVVAIAARRRRIPLSGAALDAHARRVRPGPVAGAVSERPSARCL
jgi:hypothetical protein